MYQKILKEVQKNSYFKPHQNVLIAVSGGVDSMNLLYFLHCYQEELKIKIGIAHVNHRQRPQSDEEETYLKEWAKKHNVPIFVKQFSGNFSEKTARYFRYDFFKDIMAKEGYTALVTAHHADDHAETIFMRLVRGSRLKYLKGIKAIQAFGQGQLIRPFLTLNKADLPDIFHFEDESNNSNQYLRNRIRNNYIPSLSKENPNFSKYLSELGQETELLLSALSDLTSGLDITQLKNFINQTEAVQYFLLQTYLDKFPELHLSKPQFDQLLVKLRYPDEEDWYLKAGYYLHKNKTRFSIDKIGPETDSQFSTKILKYGDIVNLNNNSFEFGQTGDIELDSQSPITLRPRQAGDQIDFGNFHKKLRRLFIDEKIPVKERQKAIIGEQDGVVIFVLVSGNLYLRKASQCVTIRAKLCVRSKETGDL